jgi:hypothetical protein
MPHCHGTHAAVPRDLDGQSHRIAGDHLAEARVAVDHGRGGRLPHDRHLRLVLELPDVDQVDVLRNP